MSKPYHINTADDTLVSMKIRKTDISEQELDATVTSDKVVEGVLADVELGIIDRLKRMSEQSADIKDSGVAVIRWACYTAQAIGAEDRYKFDFVYCTPALGWEQYDTKQDAWYFGIWVNLKQRAILCYCEGDLSLAIAHNDQELKAELDETAEMFGPPPPAFTVIDYDKKEITKHYGQRPQIKG